MPRCKDYPAPAFSNAFQCISCIQVIVENSFNANMNYHVWSARNFKDCSKKYLHIKRKRGQWILQRRYSNPRASRTSPLNVSPRSNCNYLKRVRATFFHRNLRTIKWKCCTKEKSTLASIVSSSKIRNWQTLLPSRSLFAVWVASPKKPTTKLRLRLRNVTSEYVTQSRKYIRLIFLLFCQIKRNTLRP